MDDALIGPWIEDHTTTTPPHIPTMLDLIRENRTLVFRAAILSADPRRFLARYFLRQNRYLKTLVERAMREREVSVRRMYIHHGP